MEKKNIRHLRFLHLRLPQMPFYGKRESFPGIRRAPLFPVNPIVQGRQSPLSVTREMCLSTAWPYASCLTVLCGELLREDMVSILGLFYWRLELAGKTQKR